MVRQAQTKGNLVKSVLQPVRSCDGDVKTFRCVRLKTEGPTSLKGDSIFLCLAEFSSPDKQEQKGRFIC